MACFVTNSSLVPLKTRRVEQRCTLNLLRVETFSVGVVWELGKRGVPAQVSSTSLDMVQNYVVRRQKSPRAAEHQTSRNPSANRRAPLTSTDSGSLRSRTWRRYHSRDRSHYINTTTNQEAPSRKAGESSRTQVVVDELDGVLRPGPSASTPSGNFEMPF
ncbi:hypothetical protein TNCV_4492591 [Trichonephila clavipes]|nr:hypothetical protein TNCV_4492591 [Trichonephila clavipes]